MPVLAAANLLLGMGNLGLNLLQYLSGTQSSAPPTIAPTGDYVPPFTGGQCVGATYSIIFYGYLNGVRQPNPYAASGLIGALGALYFTPNNTGSGAAWLLMIPTGTTPKIIQYFSSNTNWAFKEFTITRSGGLPDNCGNPPNPNPIAINPDGGMVDSAYAPIDSDTIVPAALPVLAPSAIAAILAALRNAANLAVLAAQLADALKAILDFLKEIEDKDSSKKSVKSRDLGAIEKDGFLRLYPFVRGESIAINLDLRFYSIPLWKRDTILGNKSPNRYHNLGRILFVSETFGIINEIEVTYTINSIPIPESAIGFYYHLGLDGITKAYSTAFYLE